MMLILAFLPFLISVRAVISILYPNSNTIWFKNSTVNLNWTSSNPTADTFFFQAVLSNKDTSVLSADQRIADSTNATADYLQISLPGVSASTGYIVSLVNTTNTSQVFSKSDPFEIQDGDVHTSSANPSATATFSHNNDIPNAKDTGSFPSSFPTGSGAAGRMMSMPLAFDTFLVQAIALMLAGAAGLATVL